MTFDDLAARNQQLEAENGTLRERLDQVEHQLSWFKRQLFGEKSERRLVVDPAVQSSLFASLGATVPSPPVEPQKLPAKKQPKQKSRQDTVTDEGLRFGADVPVEVIEVAAPELTGASAEEFEVISTKSTYRLAQRAGSYVVLEYRCPVVKHTSTGKLKSTAVPGNVIERSLADVSFMAGMAIDKCLYHLPLHRQHQRLAACGFKLSRSTLTLIFTRTAQLLAPIARAQLAHVCSSQVLAMDETTMKAGRKRPGKMHLGYFWPLYGDADEVSFTFANTRGEQVIRDLLADYEGVLLTDGYKVYEQHAKGRDGITHAQCWAHARRKFEVARDAEPDAAAAALAIIGALYEQEAWIRERKLEGPDKREARQAYCAPVVAAFWQWCDEQCQRLDLTPSNPLSKALKYAMSRRAALEVFLREPDVQVDTNHLERALRPIPMGRKNHLFCWTEVGAEHLAVLHSLLVTCRLQGVDPYTYLIDVLQRVGQHPAKDVVDLTPRRWKVLFAANPLRSDVNPEATVPTA